MMYILAWIEWSSQMLGGMEGYEFNNPACMNMNIE